MGYHQLPLPYTYTAAVFLLLFFFKILDTIHCSAVKSTAIPGSWEGICSLFLRKQKQQWAASLTDTSSLQGFISQSVITISKHSLGWKELRLWFVTCVWNKSESQSTLTALWMLLKWNSDSRETKGVIKDLDFIHCCQDVSPMTWSKFGEKNAKKPFPNCIKKASSFTCWWHALLKSGNVSHFSIILFNLLYFYIALIILVHHLCSRKTKHQFQDFKLNFLI